MSNKNLSVLVLVAWGLIARVATYSLTMTPNYTQVSEANQRVTFTCTADAVLTGCQFMWREFDGKTGPLLDLKPRFRGQVSTYSTYSTPDYSYSGRGLGAGDCGVSLPVKGFKHWMVACRVRTGNGGWTYAWAGLFARDRALLLHTVTPREAVVPPGGEARFALKAQEPLSSCRFYRASVSLNFDQGAKSPNSTGRHRYLGAGLERGECGLAISNVREEDNGPVRVYTQDVGEQQKVNGRHLALIVTRPPTAPTLSVRYLQGGVTATCEVHEARPVANISWVLGDDVVRQDSIDDSPGNPQDAWRWPWMEGSVLQRLTLSRLPKYNGKRLKCVVSHVALAQPLEATETISFTESVSGTSTLVPTSTTPATARTTPAASSNTTCSSSPTLDTTGSVSSMLGRLCQEYRGLDNTSCPRNEVDELHVRETRAAARTAELAEEQAKITLEAAKAEAASNASLAKLAGEQAKMTLAAAKVTQETAKVTLEAAKITLEAAKAEAASNASLAKLAGEQAKMTLAAAKVTLETAKITLEAAKAEAASNASLAKLAEEQAQVTLEAAKMFLEAVKSEVASNATLAKLAIEGAQAYAKADEAWRINAEEELEFERLRRNQSLQNVQG